MNCHSYEFLQLIPGLNLKLTNFLNKTCDMLSRKHKSSTGFSPQSSSWKLELSLPPYDSITSQRRGMCLISSLWSLQLSVSVRTDCAHVKNETKSRKVSPIWILSSCPFFNSYIHLGQTSSCAVARVSTINADNGQTFLPGTRYLSNRIHQPRLSRSPSQFLREKIWEQGWVCTT